MSADNFRARARAWLNEYAVPFDDGAIPSISSEADIPIDEAKKYQLALWEAGFAGITWPEEYGGQGLGEAELIAFTEVASEFVTPTAPFVVGLGMPGPTLLELGTEDQKRRYLAPLLRGEEIWCQLFSEPNAGSDVASLRTTATRTENGWLINGQKVWTSGAQYSDFGTILTRTDPTVPRHEGLTMFIVDMHHPGVTVRPLRVATGEAPFNEVYFDGVEVPGDAVIGTVGAGWAAAVAMLRHERIAVGTGLHNRSHPLGYDSLLTLARQHGLDRDLAVRRMLAQIHVREVAIATFGRLLHEEALAGRAIGARGSVAKLTTAERTQWASDLAQEILGQQLVLRSSGLDYAALAILTGPGGAAAGGSSEIQRNIIGERVLGLPKDAGSVDRKTPFNQLKISQ